jgi:hypothetical protein
MSQQGWAREDGEPIDNRRRDKCGPAPNRAPCSDCAFTEDAGEETEFQYSGWRSQSASLTLGTRMNENEAAPPRGRF